MRKEDINKKIKKHEADLVSVHEQLDTMAIIPSEYSEVDNTNEFKALIQKSINSGVRKIVLPKRRYVITKPIFLYNTSDIEIDCTNTEIIWNGSETITTDRNNMYTGVFSCHGESANVSSQVKAWIKELWLDDNIIHEDNHASRTLKCSKITVVDGSNFSNNDYIKFQIGTPNNAGNQDYQNVFKPTVSVITKILHVVGNDLYVDYWSPYDFSQVDVTTGFVLKIKPIKNVTIKNLFIHDISPYKAPSGIIGDNPNRDKIVTGVGFYYAVNCKVENIRGLGMKMPLVMGQSCYGLLGENIVNELPESHGGGEGYTVHIDGSIKCHFEDVQGSDGNSVLDYSGCAFCTAERVKGTNTYGSKTMGTHSMAEHHITFRDCEGIFGFTNGTQYFAGMGMKIVLDNCRGTLVSDADTYLDIKVIGGEIRFETNKKYYFANFESIGTDIILGYQTEILGHNRGINIHSKVKFTAGTIRCVDELADVFTRVKFNNLKSLDIINVDSDFTGFSGKLSLQNIELVNLDSTLRNIQVVIFGRNTATKAMILNIGSNVLIDTNYKATEIFTIDEIKYLDLFINFSPNIMQTKNSNINLFGFNGSTNKDHANIIINLIKGNYVSTYLNMLNVNSLDVTDSNVSYNKKSIAIGNTLTNCVASGTWDYVTNKINNSSAFTSCGFASTGGNIFGTITPGQKGILALQDTTNRVYLSNGVANNNWIEIGRLLEGTTAERPTSCKNGTPYMDTTLGIPIYRSGSVWKKFSDNTEV